MKKILYGIMIITCFFISQGHCAENEKRVARNCRVQDDEFSKKTFYDCGIFNGDFPIMLLPGQEIAWDEMVYFPVGTVKKDIVDPVGFTDKCGNVAVSFNNVLIKKQCIRVSEREELIQIAIKKLDVVDLLDDGNGFITVSIKNVSKDSIIVMPIGRNNREKLNARRYYVLK